MHALIRSKFIDDGGVSCYADPATSRWASVWKVNGVMRYAEYAWQQVDWNASPVGRFFGERNHKSSTDSNCRNSENSCCLSISQCYISRKCQYMLDRLCRSFCCLLMLSWLVSSCTTSPKSHLTSNVLNLRIASFHNTQESLEFPLWRPLPKQQKALSSNGNNFYYKPSKYSTYESRKNLDSFSLSILLLRSQSLSEQNM